MPQASTYRAGARRMQEVQTPIIATVAEWIRAHPGTISLGQGVVHYGAPDEAVRRMADAAADPRHHRYGHVAGLPPLLEGLRAKLAAENGLPMDEDTAVVVTAGANMGFVNAVLAITDPGDEVILLAPYYFNHEMAVCMAGCRVVLVRTDDAYQPRVDAIRRAVTDRTRAVVTISPNNPTGAVYSEETLRAINALCRRHGLYHVSDEAYEYFTYGEARHFSPGSIEGAAGHTISLFSFSKAYGMAGWRVGYMALPAALLPAVKKVQDTVLICPPLPNQLAALGALEAGPDYCRRYHEGLSDVRQLVLDRLLTTGGRVEVPPVEGAFYLFARVDTALGAREVVRRLIAEHGVAVIPGPTFGATDACYLRIAYGALERATVAEAMDRLARGLEDIIRT